MINSIEKEFLIQSNLIEDVGEEGLADSIVTWEYMKKKKYMSKTTILHTHKLLMRNLWSDIAGKFRKCNVSVGSRVCPSWKTLELHLPQILYNFNCDEINFKENEEDKKIKWIKESHIVFEHWHPFRDGNGRTGRIFYNWQRLKLGLPIHIIKCKERWQYYAWFK